MLRRRSALLLLALIGCIGTMAYLYSRMTPKLP
jgi:hypothetical protein